MKHLKAAIAVVAMVAGSSAYAQDFKNQVKARKGQMWVMAINLGILGNMAKGEAEYDAEAAQRAANSLAGVAMIDQMTMWPQGSDNASIDGTRALPAAWENMEDVGAKWMAFVDGATAMQAAAGNGLDALRPAMGKIGGSCKGCHDDYRAPNN